MFTQVSDSGPHALFFVVIIVFVFSEVTSHQPELPKELILVKIICFT